MVGVSSLSFVRVASARLDEWREFANTVLAVEAMPGRNGDESELWVRWDDYPYRLHVSGANGGEGLVSLGWEVADATAFWELVERLRAAGRAVDVSGDETGRLVSSEFGLHARVHGPDGIVCEIVAHRISHPEQPFASPHAAEFLTGDQGLGHAVLEVSDLEAATTFFVELLGLRVSDYISFELQSGVRSRVTFLHCNPRHHSLALLAGPAAPRLRHIMLQATRLDDVGRAYDRCYKHGVKMARTLGRHPNDEMLSFYCVSPSGFEVEFGYGARTIDDEARWVVGHYEVPSIWGHSRGS
jgi:2,3-dihydroxybiphenyl 1,2-dioxygenase